MMRFGTKAVLLGLVLGALGIGSASATPLGADGTYYFEGGAGSALHIDINAPTNLVEHYTVGLYNLDAMTAGIDDPDFQSQALQADRVILLHEYGKSGGSSFNLNLNAPAHYGIFLLRDATLADFSMGRNPYMPVFSSAGAPGSQMLQQFGEGGVSTFSFQGLQTGASGGMLRAAGFMMASSNPLSSLDVQLQYEGNLNNDFYPTPQVPENPTVPEPATLALVGLGLSVAGAMRRRRAAAR